ncbi:MAG TPA: Gfo/Idh/MocA family oxidoreductase [Acidimicrobiia bacterium]|nr:Gfo/Idh/MocA family oxidoreductase [Acidimicrobiia bacterium]
MADVVRVGLVGASAAPGWSSVAHVPALHAAEGIELAAVCTSRPESAAAAADVYGVPAFHDVRDLAAQDDIDAIAVVVRVPKHHELVGAALDAGKHVFSEWPLGATLAEAQEMASRARDAGVVTAVGLQGRHDPSLTYVRQLSAEGWFGQIVAVNATMMSGGALAHSSADAWMGAKANGANFMTIVGGHTIDAISYCLSPLAELSASVATQFPTWKLVDTGETIPVDAPDTLIVHGTLDGGAMMSLHAASVPHNATGWRMEIYGTEGTAVASTSGLPQITPIRLSGARGSDAPEELALPGELIDRFPGGPAGNVGRAYQHMAEAITAGQSFSPDFTHAEGLHRLLDLIEQSSSEGVSVSVS